jgi:hypothetical protein
MHLGGKTVAYDFVIARRSPTLLAISAGLPPSKRPVQSRSLHYILTMDQIQPIRSSQTACARASLPTEPKWANSNHISSVEKTILLAVSRCAPEPEAGNNHWTSLQLPGLDLRKPWLLCECLNKRWSVEFTVGL